MMKNDRQSRTRLYVAAILLLLVAAWANAARVVLS